jgi:hypothetical protein
MNPTSANAEPPQRYSVDGLPGPLVHEKHFLAMQQRAERAEEDAERYKDSMSFTEAKALDAARDLRLALAAAQERAERAERQFEEEKLIVDRIWDQLGRPSYDALNGRGIYDLIDELKTALATAQERIVALESMLGRCRGQVTLELAMDIDRILAPAQANTESVSIGSKSVDAPAQRVCRECDGTGEVLPGVACPRCHGSGRES